MAVAAVLAFHAGFGWAAGGFLGVSTFFTLSGFLITTLLLDGPVALGSFWSRRLRRLLPAAALTLLAVCAAAPALATADQLVRLRGDVVASLLSVLNWRLLAEGRDYGQLFAAPSPVLHFWSLAIEGQCYVVVPLVVAALARRRRALAATLVALVLAGTAAGVALGTADAYYSTIARAPELLVGGVLAVAVAARPRLVERARGLDAAALVALAGLGWAWATVPVTSPGLARGGLLAHAVASAVVVAAATRPGSVVRRALAVPPLAALGRISYGVYLFHWPIFVWLTPDRAGGVDGPALTAVHVALTLGLAVASHRLLETPIRRGRLPRPRLAAPALAAAVVVAALLATVDPPDAAAEFSAPPAADTSFDGSGPSPAGIPRVAVFGDSTALRSAYGLAFWGIQTRQIATVGDETVIGCSLGRGGLIDATGTPGPVREGCDDWPTRWRRQVADLDVDAALLQIGPWDAADRRLPDDPTWRRLGDPVYDAFLLDEMRLAVDALSSSGAKVLWLTSPHIEMERSVVPRPSKPFPASEPARMDRLNELIAQVAAERPDDVVVIDLAAHLRSRPGGELDPALRPDGVHISEEAAGEVADWLGPQIVAALGR